ncbi:MAG: hypothetical protein JKY87_07925 [Mariprofundus sp.]|nr:hypothetical protein [Mariprofundus sp.]
MSSAPAFRGFFIYKHGFRDEDLQDFLQFSDKHETKIKVKEMKASMRSLLALYEKKISTSATLFRNIALMSSRIKLCPIQMQILALVVLKERYEPLKDCFENLHRPSESHLYSALSNIMGIDKACIAKAMFGRASLRAIGLLKIDNNYRSGLVHQPAYFVGISVTVALRNKA